MTVWTDVSEADIRYVKAGQAAHFSTLGSDQRRWRGTVRQVLPAPAAAESAKATPGAPAAGTKAVQYTVLFDVDNADRRLMPQMTAQVTFVSASAQGVLTTPLAAIRTAPSDVGGHEARVLVRQDSGADQPTWRPVRLGVRDRLLAEVLEGLAPGDEVVTGEVAAPAAARRFRW